MSNNDAKKLLIKNTSWVYAGKIITQIIGLFATILIIKKLPVEVYGTYIFIFGLFIIPQLFITSPIKLVFLRYIPELIDKKEFSLVKSLIKFFLGFSFLFIGVFAVLFYFLSDFISSFFRIPDFYIYIVPFTVFLVTYAGKVMAEGVMAALIKHQISTIANIFMVILRASLYFTLFNIIDVSLLLYIEAIASVLYIIICIIGIYKFKEEYKGGIIAEKSKSLKKRISRFYIISFFSELGYGILGRTSDHYIIAAMSSPFFVGLYGFAMKIFDVFYKILPFREFESVLKPIFFKRYSNYNEDKELNDFFNFTLKVLVPLFLLPSLYFLIFGESVITNIFKDKYLPAYYVTLVTLFGIILNGLFYPVSYIIQLKERVEITMISRLPIILSIFMAIYFMHLYGIVGVALATIIGELIKNLIAFFMLRRYVKIKYSTKLIFRYSLIFIIITILFYPFQQYISSIAGLLIGSALFGIIFIILLFKLHPFSTEELKRLESLFESSKLLKKVVNIFKKNFK